MHPTRGLPAAARQARTALRDWLPGSYLAAVGAGITALVAVPYAEEFWRCARGGRG